MSLQERIETIIKRKREQESGKDFISDTLQEQPIKNCTDKLFKLIVKLEESKAKSKKEFPVQIRERIFIGNYVFASDQEFFKTSKIGLVISCLSTSPIKVFDNIQYEKVNIKDQQGEDLIGYADKIFSLIENHLTNETTSVYIHCFHGKSRSPAVLMMYLIRKERKNLTDLLNQLKKKYPKAQPNKWFLQQLTQYSQSILRSSEKIESEKTELIQQDDLLGFDIQPIQSSSSNTTSEQSNHFDILSDSSVPKSSDGKQPDERKHLLIPQNQKNFSPKKNTEYHLIEIDDDDQNADLI